MNTTILDSASIMLKVSLLLIDILMIGAIEGGWYM